MKQVIKIIGHHFKLILEVDAIVIDYRYIFHGFGPHSQTNGNNIFFEDRGISLLSAGPARAVRFGENVKNVTPRGFIVTLGIFIAPSFFPILMTEWENLVKIEN